MANGNEGIDNDYFNEITGLEPDDTSPTDSGSETNGQQPSADQSTTQGIDEGTGRVAAPTQQQERATPAPQQQVDKDGKPIAQAAPVEGLRRYHLGNYLNANGDIVNERGEIIAAKGSQRRLHDENHRLRTEQETMTTELNQLRQYQRETAFLNNVPRQYGLTNEEVAHGLDLEARIKRGDVQGVAREVTAMLAAKGVNISAILGKEVGDSVDMQAIRAMLDERLAPLDRQEQQTQQEQQLSQRAREQYNNFVRDNEYADVQADVIVAYKQRHGVTLQQAYNATRSFAVANGLDMTIPLGPQIAAALAQQQQQTQQQQPDPRRPMPNGQSTRSSGVETMKPVYADADDSWGSIISRALQENGSVN